MEDAKNYGVSQFFCGSHCYEIGAWSDIGTRTCQEDSMLVTEREGSILAAVCDGMGGLGGGDIASRTAVDLLFDLFMEEDITDPAAFFEDSVDLLDAPVYFLEDEQKNRLKSGTTIVSVLLQENRLHWLSVGDSRIYVLRAGDMVQVTRDHTYGEQLLDRLAQNRITQEQFDGEAKKHASLTSFLGIGGIRQMDTPGIPLELQPDDVVLLTSDGLYHSVDMKNMAELSGISVETMLQRTEALIAACDQPVRDNTSFVLIRYLGVREPSADDAPIHL